MQLTTCEATRYSRQIILPEIGMEGQLKLKAARVLVVGAGGLGCPVLQYLAAAGVGHIGIVDDDRVDISNLPRQILYTAADAGKNKAETAAAKLAMLNPEVRTEGYPERVTAVNAIRVISSYDLVIDGSDNFETRYLVNDTCVQLGKPLVFGAVLGFEGQVSVFNYQGGPDYRSVFPQAGDAPDCSVNGVLNVLPGVTGMYMAGEALKIICGAGETLSGRLMLIDMLSGSVSIFRIATVPGDPIPEEIKTTRLAAEEASGDTDASRMPFGVFDERRRQGSVYLVDVREPYEFEEDNIGGVNIPLHELPGRIGELAEDKDVVFCCSSGKRSRMAVKLLGQYAFAGTAFYLDQSGA